MTVSIRTMAESLAAVSDNNDGFNDDTARTIEDRLRALVESKFGPDYATELTIGEARAIQAVYIEYLKAGAYGRGTAAEWNAAEDVQRDKMQAAEREALR